MKLSQILADTGYRLEGTPDCSDPEITRICTELGDVIPGAMFVALPGIKFDGHALCGKAAEMGACAILTERGISADGAVNAVVSSTRKALALASAAFFGHPGSGMRLTAITGTNGKTTTSYMLGHIFEKSGLKTAIIGTAGYIDGKGGYTAAPYTTPEPVMLHRQLSLIKSGGADMTVMEVSSQALDQKRVYGLEFESGIFTNITADHLDYHKTMEAYRSAKLSLLSMCGKRLINADCEAFNGLERLPGVVTFSASGKKADFTASDIRVTNRADGRLPGIDFTVKSQFGVYEINLRLPGIFNVYNALGAFAAACLSQVPPDTAAEAFDDFYGVRGRCEPVLTNAGFGVMIDFAHTPDGLSCILTSLRPFVRKRLICVFGCGGDRDKSKRPVMGKIASEHSDIAIVTSDNPRTESPMAIINEILTGIETDNIEVIPDRRAAIRKALYTAGEGDLVLIAGKGHETYQVIGDRKIEFDERKIVSEILGEESFSGKNG